MENRATNIRREEIGLWGAHVSLMAHSTSHNPHPDSQVECIEDQRAREENLRAYCKNRSKHFIFLSFTEVDGYVKEIIWNALGGSDGNWRYVYDPVVDMFNDPHGSCLLMYRKDILQHKEHFTFKEYGEDKLGSLFRCTRDEVLGIGRYIWIIVVKYGYEITRWGGYEHPPREVSHYKKWKEELNDLLQKEDHLLTEDERHKRDYWREDEEDLQRSIQDMTKQWEGNSSGNSRMSISQIDPTEGTPNEGSEEEDEDWNALDRTDYYRNIWENMIVGTNTERDRMAIHLIHKTCKAKEYTNFDMANKTIWITGDMNSQGTSVTLDEEIIRYSLILRTPLHLASKELSSARRVIENFEHIDHIISNIPISFITYVGGLEGPWHPLPYNPDWSGAISQGKETDPRFEEHQSRKIFGTQNGAFSDHDTLEFKIPLSIAIGYKMHERRGINSAKGTDTEVDTELRRYGYETQEEVTHLFAHKGTWGRHLTEEDTYTNFIPVEEVEQVLGELGIARTAIQHIPPWRITDFR